VVNLGVPPQVGRDGYLSEKRNPGNAVARTARQVPGHRTLAPLKNAQRRRYPHHHAGTGIRRLKKIMK